LWLASPWHLWNAERGRDLHDLLVAALHGAVPLKEVHHARAGARAVRDDLHLDVARPLHQSL